MNAQDIKEFVTKNNPKSAIIIGGGYIGVEVSENLQELGLDVTIVQHSKQLLNPFDEDMVAFIHNEIRKHNVKLAMGYSVESFHENGNGIDVIMNDVSTLHADMIVLAIGVTPKSSLAKEAGLNIDSVILSPMSYAGYYPGGKLMTMKVIFEKETFRLLGAQIVGYDGVDKRIDVLSTAIYAGLKATMTKCPTI